MTMKTCACGLTYDLFGWSALPYRGDMRSERLPEEGGGTEVLELRDCGRYGSTLAVEVLLAHGEEPPVPPSPRFYVSEELQERRRYRNRWQSKVRRMG